MCSIFGYIASPGQSISLPTLERMAAANVARGPHAFGFAWVDARGRLHAYKQAGRITDHLGLLAMTRGARALIGHVRYATHGEPSDNINNHPHPCDGGWLVHNGVVQNHCELIKENDLYPVSECDSETLALLLENSPRKNLLTRAADTFSQAEGNLAVLALWSRPGGGGGARLLIARNGNPLHKCRTARGRLFSTLAAGLPSGSTSVADQTVAQYTLTDKGVSHEFRPIPQNSRQSDADTALYPRGNADSYAGG